MVLFRARPEADITLQLYRAFFYVLTVSLSPYHNIGESDANIPTWTSSRHYACGTASSPQGAGWSIKGEEEGARRAALGMGRGKGKVVGLAHGIVQGWCWDARALC